MCGSSRRSPRSTSHRRGLLRDLLTSSQAGPQRLPLLPIRPPPRLRSRHTSCPLAVRSVRLVASPGVTGARSGVTALPDGGAQTSRCRERVVDTLCSLLRPAVQGEVRSPRALTSDRARLAPPAGDHAPAEPCTVRRQDSLPGPRVLSPVTASPPPGHLHAPVPARVSTRSLPP